jgi:acyl carrier protein
MTTFDRVKKVLVDHLELEEDPSKVTMEAHIVDDLGADSLDVVEIIMGLEEEFEINIPDEDAEKLPTVGAIVGYVDEKSKG